MIKNLTYAKTPLLDTYRQKSTQEIYKQYEKCKLCNLGCIAEASWSTTDLGFVINQTIREIMIPVTKRITHRNEGITNNSNQ